MIAEDVKWKNQVNHVVNKANRMLGLLKRTFESRDSSLWKDLYVALIDHIWSMQFKLGIHI